MGASDKRVRDAAHDLLNALRDLSERIAVTHPQYVGVAPMIAAKKAIAKAEGRS